MKHEFPIYICDNCGVHVQGAVEDGAKCEACKRGVLETSKQTSKMDVGDRVFYDYSTLRKRTENIQMRVSPQDKKSIQTAAREMDLTLTDYILHLHHERQKK